jgi:peroxiredoxin
MKPTRYQLDSLHSITTKSDYKYIRVVQNYKNETNLFLFTEFYLSGVVCLKAISTNKYFPIFEGPRIDFYENGVKKKESNYKHNNLSGKQIEWYENQNKKSEKEIIWNPENGNSTSRVLQYWNANKEQKVIDGYGEFEHSINGIYEKGEMKNGIKDGVWNGNDLKNNYTFTENHKEGKLIYGVSIDNNKIEYPYKEIDEKPSPQKGMEAFNNYIIKNYKVNYKLSSKNISGKVYATFVINEQGKIVEAKILRDVGFGTGAEVIRVLENAENWIPAKHRGIPLKSTLSIPIII